MLWAATPIAGIARQLSADGRLMPVQKRCYLALGFFVFHENINLISFSMDKVLLCHDYFDLQV